MAKVSIGLRGWRFEEADVLEDDGRLRPVEEMPADVRDRILRLVSIVGNTCDVCWLEHDEDEEATREATVVYGEPLSEVLLCQEHEADFLYWWREEDGDTYRGSEDLADAFHEWYLDGGEASPHYAPLEHVETNPDDLPDPPDPEEFADVVEVETGERIDMREGERTDRAPNLDDETLDAADLDLDADYPG